ncbi:MAG: transcriptional repressor [Phycisphaerales bacterium]
MTPSTKPPAGRATMSSTDDVRRRSARTSPASAPPPRRTRQRDAILAALDDAARPLSPGEILAAARRAVRSLGQATVYRAIGELVAHGDAVAVELPGQPPRYELARAAARHHHHFHCDACGKVFDVAGCPRGIEELVPRHFVVARHEIVLYGRCATCAPAA